MSDELRATLERLRTNLVFVEEKGVYEVPVELVLDAVNKALALTTAPAARPAEQRVIAAAWDRVRELAPPPWDALGASRLVAPGYYTVVDCHNENVIYADSDELADALVALAHALDADADARGESPPGAAGRAETDQCPCGHSRSMHLTEDDECLFQFEDGLFCACPKYVPAPEPAP